MQQDFWQGRWRNGQIGFHQSSVETNLQEFWPHLALKPQSPVLVPLSGKSQDVLWLAQRGHRVTGLEFSAIAVEAFHLENGIPARRVISGTFDEFTYENLRVLCGDFFELSRAQLGAVAAVYDRAALIALPPDTRRRYTERMTALTSPGTQTLLLTVEYPQHITHGPPFSVTAEEVQLLYGEHHDIQALSRQDILALEPRMQARGVNELLQACYRLQRR